jgi:hypothetical protein
VTAKKSGEALRGNAGAVAAGATCLLAERANHTDPQEAEGLEDCVEISDGKEKP